MGLRTEEGLSARIPFFVFRSSFAPSPNENGVDNWLMLTVLMTVKHLASSGPHQCYVSEMSF